MEAPFAFRVAQALMQMLAPFAVTIGALELKERLLVAVQHPSCPPVTVHVYVVITVGDATGFAMLGLLRNVLGVHK